MTTGPDGPATPWRRRAVVVAAWLLTVAIGSALTFLVVDRAGRAVLDPATASAGRVPEIVDSALPTTSPPVAPTAPTQEPVSPPTAVPEPAAPAPAAPEPAVPAPQPLQQTEGGTVAISCTEGGAALSYATPTAGWRMDVREPGPPEVRVRFHSGDGEGEAEVDVRGSCVGGIPSFVVERD